MKKMIGLVKTAPCAVLAMLVCACGVGPPTSDASASEINQTCLSRVRDVVQTALVPTFSWNPVEISDRSAGLAAAEAGAPYGVEGFAGPAKSRLESVVTEKDWGTWRSAGQIVRPESVVVTAVDLGIRGGHASGCFGLDPTATAKVWQTVSADSGAGTATSARISRLVEVALAEQNEQIRVAFIRSAATEWSGNG